ncbi:MAG TPA: hypothetical protein VNC22_06485 [Sporichthya sp.]|nr:hypothetical protein [Kutzneria sp.]HVE25030.1 hypothetical protein [Sporichthya sp.]
MTDGLDQALASAGVSLLQADASLTVYRGGAPSPTPDPPYVVVRTTVDRPSDDPDNALNGRSGVWVARWFCYCVGGGPGATPEDAEVAAIAVAQRVRTQLLDVRPVIAGLSCGPIRWEQSTPPQIPDELTGVPIREAIEIFRLRATN